MLYLITRYHDMIYSLNTDKVGVKHQSINTLNFQ